MTNTALDLHDIQGNVIKGYGRFGFPYARYVFYRVHQGDAGRQFLLNLLDLITTGAPWNPKSSEEDKTKIPQITTNIAFTFQGLKHLGVPTKSLNSFPEEFIMGMKDRINILGDDEASAPENWDPIWKNPVDILITINAQNKNALKERYQVICDHKDRTKGGVEQLLGHQGENQEYQAASAVFDENGNPTPKEHFGYTDGISDPYFEGCIKTGISVIGGGKPTRLDPSTREGWEPLGTGEFILGHRDELQEYPIAPEPRLLSFNGTFMVYRKLHENVGSFNRYLEEKGKDLPGGKDMLAAKFAGRWKNGAPITTFPTREEADQFITTISETRAKRDAARAANNKAAAKQAQEELEELKKRLVAFDYNHDLDGAGCPFGAHVRRNNPRGYLEFVKDKAKEKPFNTPGALDNRRRIARRGLPYGEVKDPTKDDGEHGIIFMALNTSIKRQFEFLQQQWINYGNDFKLSNDKDPLLGNHSTENGKPAGRTMIEADPENGQDAPLFCSNLPRFVETRGGDYFFVPSVTAIRMIGEGIIDPT